MPKPPRPKHSTQSDDTDAEFPLLRSQGLYASQITGDGNCLFRALAEQLYGDAERHAYIRHEVVSFLREHKTRFIGFLPAAAATAAAAAAAAAGSGGRAVRRSTRRGDHGDAGGHTTDVMWERYLETMDTDGVYGDNLEIVAFASRFDVCIKIHLAEFAYVVSGGNDQGGGGREKNMLHIAYHQWEHYSSIRNIDGPHHGLPEVREQIPQQSEAQLASLLEDHKYCQPWMEKVVRASLPDLEDESGASVRDAIEKFKGDVNRAVDYLFERMQHGGDTGDEATEVDTHDETSTCPAASPQSVDAPVASSSPSPPASQEPSSPPSSLLSTSQLRRKQLQYADVSTTTAANARRARYATRAANARNARAAAAAAAAAVAGAISGEEIISTPPQVEPLPKRKETARERKERQKRESKERRLLEQQSGDGGKQQQHKDPGMDRVVAQASASKVVYI
ncbi:uncharacterized protein V1518DRAFT_411314 [Limtongia smithiae]|uniref:uncharacterized protein n=1 Tax=Limtongia smithiae TaxID=1125753 RepID=UPI0034CE9043